MELGLSGYYKIIKSLDKDCKQVTYESDWMSNLITNSGMDQMATDTDGLSLFAQISNSILVGAGNTTPQFTDTSLETLIASSSPDYLNRSQGTELASNYSYYRQRHQFGEGVAAGNVAEVGYKLAGQTDLFSRALVVDSNGDPTTITVLSNEFLTVVYELRITHPASDSTATIDFSIDGTPTPTDVIVRANGLSSIVYWAWDSDYAYKASLGAEAMTSTDTGTLFGNSSNNGSYSYGSYTSGSYNRDLTVSFGINNGNIGEPVNVIVMMNTLCGSSWKVYVDPALDKDNTKTLSVTINIAWARA